MGTRRRIGNLGLGVALAATLAGCAGAPSFPALPVGDAIGQKTLTPKEQEAEIKSLSDAQAENSEAAGGDSPAKIVPAAATTP